MDARSAAGLSNREANECGSGMEMTRSAFSDCRTNSWRTDDAKPEIPLGKRKLLMMTLTLYRQEIGDEIIRSCTSKGLEALASFFAQHARESYHNTLESLMCLHPAGLPLDIPR
jgi:hypothetical protein